jgi:hypothetical protein
VLNNRDSLVSQVNQRSPAKPNNSQFDWKRAKDIALKKAFYTGGLSSLQDTANVTAQRKEGGEFSIQLNPL